MCYIFCSALFYKAVNCRNHSWFPPGFIFCCLENRTKILRDFSQNSFPLFCFPLEDFCYFQSIPCSPTAVVLLEVRDSTLPCIYFYLKRRQSMLGVRLPWTWVSRLVRQHERSNARRSLQNEGDKTQGLMLPNRVYVRLRRKEKKMKHWNYVTDLSVLYKSSQDHLKLSVCFCYSVNEGSWAPTMRNLISGQRKDEEK